MDYIGCADPADQRVEPFLTGMRQYIGIAQAVLHRPAVLFLDEPTAGSTRSGFGSCVRRSCASTRTWWSINPGEAQAGTGAGGGSADERAPRHDPERLSCDRRCRLQQGAVTIVTPAHLEGADAEGVWIPCEGW